MSQLVSLHENYMMLIPKGQTEHQQPRKKGCRGDPWIHMHWILGKCVMAWMTSGTGSATCLLVDDHGKGHQVKTTLQHNSISNLNSLSILSLYPKPSCFTKFPFFSGQLRRRDMEARGDTTVPSGGQLRPTKRNLTRTLLQISFFLRIHP